MIIEQFKQLPNPLLELIESQYNINEFNTLNDKDLSELRIIKNLCDKYLDTYILDEYLNFKDSFLKMISSKLNNSDLISDEISNLISNFRKNSMTVSSSKTITFKNIDDTILNIFSGFFHINENLISPKFIDVHELIIEKDHNVFANINEKSRLLTPALCYHCYPIFAQNFNENRIMTISGNCFRKENSYDKFRLGEFYMREFVFFNNSKNLIDIKNQLISILYSIGNILKHELNIKFKLQVASDSFLEKDFKRTLFQILFQKKIELQLYSIEYKKYISIASINIHDNYFIKKFNLETDINSMCIGLGFDRINAILLEYI